MKIACLWTLTNLAIFILFLFIYLFIVIRYTRTLVMTVLGHICVSLADNK